MGRGNGLDLAGGTSERVSGAKIPKHFEYEAVGLESISPHHFLQEYSQTFFCLEQRLWGREDTFFGFLKHLGSCIIFCLVFCLLSQTIYRHLAGKEPCLLVASSQPAPLGPG